MIAVLLVLLTAPGSWAQDRDTIAPGADRIDTVAIPAEIEVDSAMVLPRAGIPAGDSIPAGERVPARKMVPPPAAVTDSTALPANAETGGGSRKEEREIAISSGKAMLYSAIIPGGGQFYNRKYWKIPIVYGGFVALGVSINFNQNYYSEFVRELNYRGDGDPLTEPKYDEELIPSSRIIEARNYYRRYRDLCIIGVGVLYGLNIVDAYVDAELSNFDISEDLSMRVSPTFQFDPFGPAAAGAAPGLSITFAIQ